MARTDGRGTGFYHADGNGNVSLLVDGAGDVLARYLYDAFGQLLGRWGPLAQANVYRFGSKPMDVWTGAYDFGYRDYQPNLQRWLNRDPLQERGGINLYDYVGNNPVTMVDPRGDALWLNWPILPILYNLTAGPKYGPTDGEQAELPEEYNLPTGGVETSGEMPVEDPITWVPPGSLNGSVVTTIENDFATPPPLLNILTQSQAEQILNPLMAKPAQLSAIKCNDGGTPMDLFEDEDPL